MQGFILVNAYSESEDYLYQARRLEEEFTRLGADVRIVRNRTGIAALDDNGKIDLREGGDFCVFFDKDKYVARLFEKAGVRLFNRAQAVETCDDKMLTHIALSQKGIPMPASMPAPLCYTQGAALSEDYAQIVTERLGMPVVIKQSYGSLGKGVSLARSKEELIRAAKALRFTPHFYQRFVSQSYGRDVRLIAVGGEAVCAMERRSEGDFRSNVALGGHAVPVEIDQTMRKTAREISAALGLDYCGIDLLYGEEGFLVCEVNSNAYFGGMERTTGYNVARRYAEYVLETMR